MKNAKEQGDLAARGGFYRVLVENTMDMIDVLSADGIILYSSPSVKQVLGYLPEEMMGVSSIDLVHPKDRALWEDLLEKVRRELGDISLSVDIRVRQRDGAWRYVEKIVRILDESFGIPTFVVCSRDITERRSMETALAESEHKFRLIAENAPVGIYVIQDRIIQYANPRYAEIYGYRLSEIIGRKAEEFVLTDDVPYVRDLLSKRESGELKTVVFSFRGVTSSGRTVRLVSYGGQAVHNDRPAVMGMLLDVTEQERLKEELRQSEADYRSLVENIQEAVYRVSWPELKYLYANPSASWISGYSSEELLNMRVSDLVSPEDSERLRAHVDEVIRLLQPESSCTVPLFTTQIICKDGSRKWIETTTCVARDSSGTVVAVQNVARDITERMRYEEALRESEKRFRFLAENTNAVFWVVEPASAKITYISPIVEKMLGYKVDEVIGEPMERFLPKVDLTEGRDRFFEMYQAAAEGRLLDLKPFEFKFPCKDGSFLWVEASISANIDASGAVISVQGMGRDITERKEAEETLRLSREEYRLLAENINYAIQIIDLPALTYRYNNPVVEKVLGYTPDEFKTMTADQIVPPETMTVFWEHVQRSQADPSIPPVMELEVIHKDGRRIWLESTYKFICDTEGKVVALQTVSRDITDRRVTERALRESEERYRELMDTMSDAVAQVDPITFRYLYVNEATVRLSGYSREELLTMGPADITSPDENHKFRDYVTRFIDAEAADPSHASPPLVRKVNVKDGGLVWLETLIKLQRGDTGVVKLIQVVSRDITERIRTLDALRQSEEKYRLLAENMSDFVTVLDVKSGKYLYASPSVERHTQYTVKEVLALDFRTTLTPASLAVAEARIAEAVRTAATGGKAEIEDATEIEVVRKDGSHAWFETAGSLIYDETGDLVAIQMVNRDITARKAAEEALRASELRYRHLTENMSDFVTVLDVKSGKYLYVSPVVERYTQYTAQEVMAVDFRTILTPASQKVAEDRIARAIQTATDSGKAELEAATEIEVVRKDGNHLWLEAAGSPIYDETGDLVAIQMVSRDITDRKNLEKTLKEREERYRFLAENINDMIQIIDLRTFMYTYVNVVAEKMMGYGADEWPNLLPEQLALPEDLERFRVYVQMLIDDPSLNEPFEGRAIRKDGTSIYLESTCKIVRDEAGVPVSIQVVSRDVTERKRVEAALRQKEEQYRQLAESMTESVTQMELPDMRVIYVNPAILGLTGYTPEEILSLEEPWYPIAPEYRSMTKDYLVQHLDAAVSGTVFSPPPLEIKAVRKDGTPIWVGLTCSVIRDDSGRARVIQTVNRDITERKRVEEALHKSEEQYRQLAEQTSDMIMALDLSTAQIIHANPAMERTLGYAPGEMYGMDVTRLLTPESDLKAQEYRRSFFERGQVDPHPIELQAIRKDGTILWVEAVLSYHCNEAGLPERVQAISRDITQRKKAEEELAIRTADLSRSNAELENFAYIASHDLQEPLRMVASFTELLAKRYKGKMDKDADDFIAYAVDGANRMKQLINDLLDFSRVGTRGKPLAALNCNDIVEKAKNNLALALQDAGATVVTAELPVVMGDAGQLIQLFQNLIGNALKFHGAETPLIDISVQQRENDWLFAVRDNGIGVCREDFERIFAIFQRAVNRKDYAGTGIGLAICKRIVERHGGRIWLESQIGQGATFYFTLPR